MLFLHGMDVKEGRRFDEIDNSQKYFPILAPKIQISLKVKVKIELDNFTFFLK